MVLFPANLNTILFLPRYSKTYSLPFGALCLNLVTIKHLEYSLG